MFQIAISRLGSICLPLCLLACLDTVAAQSGGSVSPDALAPDAQARQSQAGSDGPLSPAPDLTLRQALDLAFAKHPGLEANRRSIAARQAGLAQASRGLNPDLSLELEDIAGSGLSRGFSKAQTTLQLTQTLELGGKRAGREGLARAETNLAEKAMESKRMEIHALVCGYFMAGLYAQRRHSLALEALSLSERLHQTVTRRVAEGAASTADEIRARLAVSEAGMELRQDTLRLTMAKRKLALLWGEEKPLPALRDEMEALPDLLPLDQVLSRTASGPPAQGESLNIRVAEAKLRQQRGLYSPDLTFSAGLRHRADAGDIGWVGGLSFPLPFRNRGQGSREEARQELEQSKADQQAALLDLKTLAGETHEILALAREEIRTLADTLIPDAAKAATVLSDGYRKGRFAMLEVLNAENDLFRLRLRHLEGLLRYWNGHADLERLLGSEGRPVVHGKEE